MQVALVDILAVLIWLLEVVAATLQQGLMLLEPILEPVRPELYIPFQELLCIMGLAVVAGELILLTQAQQQLVVLELAVMVGKLQLEAQRL
jgi:hypothetical protein